MAHTIIVASIASGCFVIFVMPSSPTAQPKNLVGDTLSGSPLARYTHFSPMTLFSQHRLFFMRSCLAFQFF